MSRTAFRPEFLAELGAIFKPVWAIWAINTGLLIIAPRPVATLAFITALTGLAICEVLPALATLAWATLAWAAWIAIILETIAARLIKAVVVVTVAVAVVIPLAAALIAVALLIVAARAVIVEALLAVFKTWIVILRTRIFKSRLLFGRTDGHINRG